ncbi:hypothetical protein JS533_012240 [Bifidobacterium amazonense]|uniref:Uncharacterized protein n=1 Tax=Bifidobacterium amazonense TaxID=2809027 RepID=A0ABS9VYG7_9BIFI|nr:hypothetical protein [Bifidobacterium amazonense]MCH9277024.1 hypothetical protein [Bifidobacterium amazonense]
MSSQAFSRRMAMHAKHDVSRISIRLSPASGALATAYLLYAVIQIVLAVNHEPWRDESQAWLIARDASPWQILSEICRQEGHPALWFFVLMPFARLGVGYWSLEALSITITLVAAALLMFAKTPAAWKLPLLFTPVFFYWPSVVSRSYCLIALFAAALALLYPSRSRHPWLYAVILALLFQTHALVFAFAGMLALLQAIEWCRTRRRFPLPFLLPVGSAVAALLELMGGEQPVSMSGSVLSKIKMMTSPIAESVFAGHQTIALATVILLIIAALAAAFLHSISAGLYGTAGVLWLTFMDVVLYPIGSIQKIAGWFALFMLIVPFSISDNSLSEGGSGHKTLWRYSRTILASATALVALLMAPATMRSAYADLREPFSSGKALGVLLNTVETHNAVIVPIEDRGTQYAVSNALPYLTHGQTMWSMAVGGQMSYVTNEFRSYWNEHGSVSDDAAPQQTAELIQTNLANADETIIVACSDSGNTALDSAFAQYPQMVGIGVVDEPQVDESLRSAHGGIRCSVYQYHQ